jgi:hypothetical protein
MRRDSITSATRGLLILIGSAALALSATFIVGRLFLPRQMQVPQPDASTLDETDLGDVWWGAVVLFAGEDDEPISLGPGDYEVWQRDGVPGDQPLNLRISFGGRGSVLRIAAPGLAAGVPVSEGTRVVLRADGLSYEAAPGRCTVELLELEFHETDRTFFVTHAGQIVRGSQSPRAGPSVYLPRFVGRLHCDDALREDGAVASFEAVFRFDDRLIES